MAGIEKELMLRDVKKHFEGKSLFFTSFDKVNVGDFGKLRESIRKASGKGMVVKKTIAAIALRELGVEEATTAIDGPLFIVAAVENQPAVSKELVKFAKEQENFVIKGVYMDGAFHSKSYVDALSELPSREELIASVVGGMKAPINNFVLGLNSIIRSFAVCLNELSKKKSEN